MISGERRENDEREPRPIDYIEPFQHEDILDQEEDTNEIIRLLVFDMGQHSDLSSAISVVPIYNRVEIGEINTCPDSLYEFENQFLFQ